MAHRTMIWRAWDRVCHRFEWVSWAVLLLTGLLMLFPAIGGGLSKWEGRRYPVLDPMLTVISTQPVAGGTQIRGEAVKVRGNCVYIPGSLKWWYGTANGPRVHVPAHFSDKPATRPAGRVEWTGIVVSLSPENIQTLSFATVEHDCGRPWPVKSLFYVAPPLVSAITSGDMP